MKILSAAQTRLADQYTILHEPVPSTELMERAARAFCDWFEQNFQKGEQEIFLLCGSGNNGGDGLAIARMLHLEWYEVRIFLCHTGSERSPDCQINLERLPAFGDLQVLELREGSPFPEIPSGATVIDALFGSGLNRPVTGYWADCLRHFSAHKGVKVAVDLPSGLFADGHRTEGDVFHADYTFSFQRPKLAFFFPENAPFVGRWAFGDIGLDEAFIEAQAAPWHLVTGRDVYPLIKKRPVFSHKGTFGHALLICGSYGMMGAATLSARACLRAGTGLLSLHVPSCGHSVLQTTVPEAMAQADPHAHYWTTAPDTSKYTAIGVGPGIGKDVQTLDVLETFLKKSGDKPIVLDADALNLIAAGGLHRHIPPNTILTPHPGEFERLFGASSNTLDRLGLLRESAVKYRCHILLKGAYSCLATPQGDCYFNPTGNPGMATAGSGDVLTGILTGLLAQGYAPEDAARAGVFLHGRAGDIAGEKYGQASMIAGDIIECLGGAFRFHEADQVFKSA
jgi:NAD(P)H-hydrate epimerase